MKLAGEWKLLGSIANMLGSKVVPMFQSERPDEVFLKRCVGRMLNIKGKKVVIKTVVGSVPFPGDFEINGTHRISMLRFYAQMNGDTSITEQQFRDFEAMEFDVIQGKK